jgi:hypothetical protein
MVKRYIERASLRKKVDIAARLIVLAERYTIIPCRIVDRSQEGMKVEMHVSFPLPDKFFLLGDESEDLYECDMRWQNGTAVGLKIIDVCVNSNRRTVLANAANAVELGPRVEVEPTLSEGHERARPVRPPGKVTQ